MLCGGDYDTSVKSAGIILKGENDIAKISLYLSYIRTASRRL